MLSANLNKRSKSLVYLLFLWVAYEPPVFARDEKTISTVDYCADQYVLAVAERSQLKTLSKRSLEVFSFHREEAKGIPQNTGSAEEIISYHADVNIRHWGGSASTDVLFKRAGINSVKLDYAVTQDAVFKNIRKLAKAIGKAETAEAIISRTETRLQKLRSQPRAVGKAVYITPSGFTAGANTYVNDVITSAGFNTMAEDLGIHSWATLPLESLVLNKPDVVIASFYDLPETSVSNWSISKHPYIKRLLKDTPTIIVPSKYLSCNAIFFADAVEFIRSEGEKLNLYPQPIETAR